MLVHKQSVTPYRLYSVGIMFIVSFCSYHYRIKFTFAIIGHLLASLIASIYFVWITVRLFDLWLMVKKLHPPVRHYLIILLIFNVLCSISA